MENKLKQRFEKMYETEDPWGIKEKDCEKLYLIGLNSLIKRKFSNCLDLGCGEGRILNEISKFCKEVTGVDISNKAIDRAKKNYPKIKFKCSDVLNFLKENKKYDLITCLEMLYYLDDKKRKLTLNLIKKRLDKKGKFILGVVVNGKNKYGRYFKFEEIKKLLEERFEIEKIISVVARPIDEIPITKLIIKVLCRINHLLAFNFVSKLNPEKYAYQVLFLCRNKNP